ncbi:9943_t:CDS:2 [Gigaspora margarita]|uniref:Protein PNS1 n=1 Tax=Gigaspora margarita TaxID=4874 RepID=A0ABM8VX62_GIGMA|nr:9943_t:CDS:2 [Gigaspora margarita]
MFSQHTKNLWNQPRGSVSSDSSQEPGASLFYSVPNLLADAEIRESISLQPSQVRNYNQYDDDDEYLGSDPVPGTDFLEAPFSDNRNTQTAAAIYRNIPPTPITRVSSDTLSEGLLPSSSPLIWGILVSVPFIFAIMFIWTVVAALTGPRQESGKRDPQDILREQSRDTSKDTPALAFHKATTSSLGSICLGSLIMFTVQCLQFISEFVKKNSKLNTVFYHAATCMSYIDGLIDVLNNYTLIYVGISGESFCSSAMFTTKLFRRNLIFGLVNASSPTFIFVYRIDATFLCYTIDLDTNKTHCPKAHDAFSNFQIQ